MGTTYYFVMEKPTTNRVDALVATFLQKGLTASERDELKEALKDEQLRNYFRACYQLWDEPTFVRDNRRASKVFRQVWHRINAKPKNLPQAPRKSLYSLSLAQTVAATIAAFVVGATACYALLAGQPTPANPPAKHKITVPLGSQSAIELPDGTRVKLNAGSQLEYSTRYNAANREVWLTGEAYFEVAKHQASTFVVHAHHVLIKAFGTEFNVKAYADEEVVQTTLVNGAVRVEAQGTANKPAKQVDLLPNQMLTVQREVAAPTHTTTELPGAASAPSPTPPQATPISPKTQGLSTQTVNTLLYTSWKDDRWVIQGEPMEGLVQKLQRRYGIEIQICDEALKHYTFSGILEDETVEQVLEIMKTVAPIEYTMHKKQVSLRMNQHQQKAFDEQMN